MALSRSFRWVLLAAGSLAALIALAALVLPRLINLNRYAPVIAGQIRQLTGREARLGAIAFSLLPVPAVSVSPVTVADGPLYPGRDALRIASLSIRLRLSGLLRGRLEFGTIVVDRPTLTLIRDAQGRWNYDDLLQRAEALRARPAAGAPAPSAPAGPQIAIERALVRSGRVLIYDDAVVPGRRSEVTIGPVDAEVTGWGLGGSTSVVLSVGLGKSVLRANAKLEGTGEDERLELTVPDSRLEVPDFATLLPWLGVARPNGLTLKGGVSIAGRAAVPLQRMSAVQFAGTLTLDDLSYRDATLSRPIERIGGTLRIDGQQADWQGFTATVGTSELRGNLRVENFLRPRIGFKLESPRLDANQLIETLSAPSAPAPSRKSSPAPGEPGAGLAQVSAQGTLKVGALRFQTFDLEDVQASVSLKDKVLELADLKARLYGGKLDGSTRLNLAGATPQCRLEGALRGVDVNALAGAYDPALKGLLRGTLGGTLAIDAAGTEMDAILSSARGAVDVQIARGALTSFSILKQMAALLEMAGGKGIGREETPFESLGGRFVVANRQARTDNLALDSTDLDLAGTGSVGLDAKLDLAVLAQFSEEASKGMVAKTGRIGALTDSAGRVTLHLLARGSLAQPEIGLDTRAQSRQFQRQKKDELKDKLRDKLLDLLGGGGEEEAPPPE